MDLVKELVEEVKSELLESSKNIENNVSMAFFTWMKNEYKNYMLTTREDYLSTLVILEDAYPEFKPFIEVLRNNIGDYGATQAFFRASLDLSNVI